MTLKAKGILSGLVCLLSGGLVYYYQGYKDNSFVKYSSIGFVYTGWVILIVSLFSRILFTDKKVQFASNRLYWFKDKGNKLIIYISFAVAIIGTMEYTGRLGERRVYRILRTEPTENTIGTIIKIESRNTRGGSKLWAIIEYNTKPKKILQAVYNYKEKYSVGQRYLVCYSNDYPEMFEIIERKE